MAMESEYYRHRGETPRIPGPVNLGDRPALAACLPTDPRREKLEQYISAIFHASYGATILEYLPLLFSLQREGGFSAALGLRSAAEEPLFCEQYLDDSVESQVQALYGRCAERCRIMELGNLVSSRVGESAFLYLLVTAALHEAGVEYLLFAANRAVRHSIRRSGFTPLIAGPARRESLGPQGDAWGSYYDGSPMVMLADISLTMRQARSQLPLLMVLSSYQDEVEQLADVLRQSIP